MSSIAILFGAITVILQLSVYGDPRFSALVLGLGLFGLIGGIAMSIRSYLDE